MTKNKSFKIALAISALSCFVLSYAGAEAVGSIKKDIVKRFQSGANIYCENSNGIYNVISKDRGWSYDEKSETFVKDGKDISILYCLI